MDWVPDLIGNPPRREENGGDQIQKTVGVQTRRFVEQSEIETEIAVEIEIGETEIGEIQSCETESCEKGETGIVRLESEIPELEWFEQRLERWQHPDRGRPQRRRRRRRQSQERRSGRRQSGEQSESSARRRRGCDRRSRWCDGTCGRVQRRTQKRNEKPQSRDAAQTQGQDQVERPGEGSQRGWE